MVDEINLALSSVIASRECLTRVKLISRLSQTNEANAGLKLADKFKYNKTANHGLDFDCIQILFQSTTVSASL